MVSILLPMRSGANNGVVRGWSDVLCDYFVPGLIGEHLPLHLLDSLDDMAQSSEICAVLARVAFNSGLIKGLQHVIESKLPMIDRDGSRRHSMAEEMGQHVEYMSK